ncbi:MAG: hypothetical protein LAN71_12345 [Acidobacteriia bacterium]|nr:hypothetical protein [Terriglobia bacterium]
MKAGDLVEAQIFPRGIIVRKVVEIKQDTVYLCTEEEWLSAQKEHREPICAGFNMRYINPVTVKSAYH